MGCDVYVFVCIRTHVEWGEGVPRGIRVWALWICDL